MPACLYHRENLQEDFLVLFGECTLVIAPPAGARLDTEGAGRSDDIDALLRSLLAQGVPASTLAQALRAIPGVGRNQAYARVLALGDEAPREQ